MNHECRMYHAIDVFCVLAAHTKRIWIHSHSIEIVGYETMWTRAFRALQHKVERSRRCFEIERATITNTTDKFSWIIAHAIRHIRTHLNFHSFQHIHIHNIERYIPESMTKKTLCNPNYVPLANDLHSDICQEVPMSLGWNVSLIWRGCFEFSVGVPVANFCVHFE